MNEYTTTINKEYSIYTNSILSHTITLSQSKRTYSTVEFTCTAEHYIQGELDSDLDFFIYRKNINDEKVLLFYSQLNPLNKIISSDIGGEKKIFLTNNFRIVLEDVKTEEDTVNLVFEVKSSNSKFNYSFNQYLSYSTFITKPVMTGSLDVAGTSLSSNIINYFADTITISWDHASEFVNQNTSNGYILSHSLDGGNSWFDTVLTSLMPLNGKCNYSFNIENFPNDSAILFKVCCFNDLNIKSNEIFSSKTVYKCNFNPVKNVKSVVYNGEEVLNEEGIITNEATKITVSYDSATCSNKLGQNLQNLYFYYHILFPADGNEEIIYQGNQPIDKYSHSSANILTLDINIVDNLEGVKNSELYILRDKLNKFLGDDLVKNINFIVRSEIISNSGEKASIDAFAHFSVNLFGYEIIPPYNLTINNNSTSTAHQNINGLSYLIPDGEKYINLTWQPAKNIYNSEDLFLYDIFIGIDGVYTYENTTTNLSYKYKMKKVDKKSVLSFYLVARNKYSSVTVESGSIPSTNVDYYNRPYLTTFDLNRNKNSCSIKFILDIDTSITEIMLNSVRLNVTNVEPGSVVVTPNNSVIPAKTEVNCIVNNLRSETSYTLVLNYSDNSGLSDIIVEEFNIPSATPIMEITPECITMGGADINNDYILNIKGNANIDGSLNVKPYVINALLDDINSFKNSGVYTCDYENSEILTAHLPLVGSFNMVVINGIVPIQFLLYTQEVGDNYIYMRNCINNLWSEWILLHQKSFGNE